MSATALILAAGSGTRMKSSHSKVVFELLGKPLIRWVVDAAKEGGCDRIICVLGHGIDEVSPLVSDCDVAIQSERLGTGHAVMMAEEMLRESGEDVVVLSGDSPLIRPETISSLISTRRLHEADAVVLSNIADDPSGYGRIIRNAFGAIERIVEQKDCSEQDAQIKEVNSGIYCFKTTALLNHLQNLSNDNAQNEYYLTDVIALMVAAGQKVEALIADDSTEAMGINDRFQLSQAQACMQHRINKKMMLSGVTIIDPSLTWIGPDVEIEPDVEIWPMSFLMGKTKIASDCKIGPNSRLTDTSVGRGCTVEESILIESILEDEVNCGPRAYLRSGTHMMAGSKAGTHVEIKNSTVGPNSKVPHLSYIGDTTIGVDVNVGAGSITCNYDGQNKNKTVIGDRTFIGSDTMMVAPVKIGSDCTVGAGSTITHDVPDGSLGIARSKQKNILNWTRQKKDKQ